MVTIQADMRETETIANSIVDAINWQVEGDLTEIPA